MKVLFTVLAVIRRPKFGKSFRTFLYEHDNLFRDVILWKVRVHHSDLEQKFLVLWDF